MKEIEALTLDDFVDSEFPYELLFEHHSDPFDEERMKTKLQRKAIAVGFKNFTKTYEAYKKKRLAANQINYGVNITEFEGQEQDLICRDWKADEFGVTKFMGREEVVACNHPILPVERLVNIDTGVEQLKLAFRKGKAWRYVTAPKEVLASNNKILSLANSGVAVTSDSARYLVQYLHDIESYNYDTIPEHNSVSRMGWISDDMFVPYVDDLVFEGDDGYKNAFKSIHPHGSFPKWLNMASSCRKYSLISKIVLASSFASVLVKKVEALPFFVHLWGSASGTGKTVALMMAASVWASPMMGEYVRTFNSTAVGNEQAAGFMNSLPLILDEFQLNKNKKDFEATVYLLSEGVGKTRGAKTGGIQRTLTWRNCILTSGEMPITNFMTGAGAYNRIVELECASPIFQDVRQSLEVFRGNYGHAGKIFVDKLTDSKNVEKAAELYRGFYNEIVESDTTEKQAMAGAVILTADKLACEWIFQGAEPLEVSDITQFLHTKAEVDINQRAYSFLCETVEMNLNHFNLSNDNVEIWGRMMSQFGKVCIIRSVFERICTEQGYSSQALLSWLKREKLINTTIEAKTGKELPTKVIKIKGSAVRCIVLTLKNDEFTDDCEDFDLIPD